MIDQIIKTKTSVLLVEQDEGLKQLIACILYEHYQIIIVDTIIEAWRYLFSDESLPNLLIVDLDIAPQEGVELTKQIKANGILREIPIITLCSEQTSLIPNAQDVGEIFIKPFNPDHLKEKIRELIVPKTQ